MQEQTVMSENLPTSLQRQLRRALRSGRPGTGRGVGVRSARGDRPTGGLLTGRCAQDQARSRGRAILDREIP